MDDTNLYPDNNSDQIRLKWEDLGTREPVQQTFPLPVTIGRSHNNNLTLNSDRVSRNHAVIEMRGNQVVIRDLESSNGTHVNQERILEHPLADGDLLQIGPFVIEVDVAPFALPAKPADKITAQEAGTLLDIEEKSTLLFTEQTGDLLPLQEAPVEQTPAFPPASFKKEIVSVAELRASGFHLDETTYLAVGGGLGSFVWVDHLVIYGASPRDVAAIGLQPEPYGRYARLCQNSQIPLHERLRSDSGSTPDNIWGWPGYAVREIWDHLKNGRLIKAGKTAWQIFGEPSLAETFTPISGRVFNSIDKEARRIGWDKIWRYGHAKAIRKTDDGRYVVAYSQSSPETGRRHCLIIATYLHIAVGYPGIRLLPDLQKYREETHDFKAVVNAYENHEQIYEHLRKEGGVVLLRGRGIVASRVLQRLYETRAQNTNIAVLHLMRSPVVEGNKYGPSRRSVNHHWEYQPFNWPKGSWGGEQLITLEKADDPTRDQLLNDWGGTTTADRGDWRRIVNSGVREGWYQIRFGSVKQVEREPDGQLATIIKGKGQIEEEARLVADFIIDCTGLEAKVETNPLLKDLLEHYKLGRNPKGRLKVANDFELIGMQNGTARMYAAGAMTLGGPHAAVDSFLGLQFAAQRSVDALTRHRAPGLRYLNGFRSIAQWLRWARGVAP